MDNQTRLLKCALRLFSHCGYAGVGVQDVVDAAGLTKPTLYHYFGSKRGLLDALLEREAAPMINAVVQASVYQGDLVQTLERLAQAYFHIAQERADFYRMSLAMQYSPPESEPFKAIQPYARRQQQILEEVFVRASVQHGNMAGRQKRYAAGLLGALNAAISLHYQGDGDLDDQDVYRVVHQFMHGIFS